MFYRFVFICLFFAVSIYPSTPMDSLAQKESKGSAFSKRPRMHFAPVVAFGVMGATLGGWIGGSIDPPKKGPPGEMWISISKTGAISCLLGAIVGGYIGYRLAQRDVKRIEQFRANFLDQSKDQMILPPRVILKDTSGSLLDSLGILREK